MTETMDRNAASEFDGAHFGRERVTGVIMGLGLPQVIFLGVGVMIAVFLVTLGGFPGGLIQALIVGGIFVAVGVPRPAGKTMLEWIGIRGKGTAQSAFGQNEYVQEMEPVEGFLTADGSFVPEAGDLEDYETVTGHGEGADDPTGRSKKGRIRHGRGDRLKLPGELGELRLFQMPGGAAFIYDPRRKEGIIVAEMTTTKAFDLEAFERKEDRLRSWANALSGLTRTEGIARVQFSDQTTVVSGAKVMSWYERKRLEAPVKTDPETGEEVQMSGPGIDPFLDGALINHMNMQDGAAVHEPWMAIVLSRRQLAQQIHAAGGRLSGFMEVALSVMSSVERAVPDSGAHVVRWHTPRSVAALIRSAGDPSSSVEISDREGDFAGVSPSQAGMMHGVWSSSRFQSDGALHRTFKISEWPQKQAGLGFLEKFVFAGDYRHTVSLYVKPRNTRKALKSAERRKSEWDTTNMVRAKFGKQASREFEREIEDLEYEEDEVVSGHAAVSLVCLITVSAFSEEELESHTAALKTVAAEAACEIRPTTGEHPEGFAAAALPLGWLEIR